MIVTFLKKHTKYRPGDEVDLSDALAGYLIKTGVATIEEEEPEATEKKLEKKLKAAAPKKQLKKVHTVHKKSK